MKPAPLSIPDKSSAYFSSPYHASPLSPIADNSPIAKEESSASSPSFTGSQTPLLDDHRSSRWFPLEHRSLWTRLRIALSGKSMARSGAAKRLIFAGLLSVLLFLVFLSSGREGFGIGPSRHATGVHRASSADAEGVLGSPRKPESFRFPEVFGNPFRKPSSPSRPSVGQRDIDISSETLPVEASLRERLEIWRNAPGGRGEVEGEVELGGFVRWNLEQCETIHEQHNVHMIQKSANVWATMNRTTVHEHRMSLIGHMEGLIKSGVLNDYGEGRGIVMVAGNADTLQRVKWTLQMLRSYNSKLPVQIWHFPSERPDDSDSVWEEMKELGAELVEAVGQEKDKGKNKSYHLKAIAIVQCPWREVLYLDSDSIPTRDPDYMFEAPNFRRLGLWATPDYWKTSANNPIWAIMGVKCRNEWEMETGQMFIDKKSHLDVFLLVKYMLERHEWWFFFSDGDKDIFRWAMLALRKRWGVPGRWVGAGALPSGTASGDFCSHTMLQHDSWGEPLFVHYNLLKQIPSGVGRGFSWGRTKQLPLFNTWPATPSTARMGEPVEKPLDDDLPGLGDLDCDMLADADEHGVARREAKEMIMRRAVRERGVKVKYHGGWISALCIDLEYIDPRPVERREADDAIRAIATSIQSEKDKEWEVVVEAAKEAGEPEPVRPIDTSVSVVPDWGQSPLEVVQWGDDGHLNTFENTLYDFGFRPSGPGF